MLCSAQTPNLNQPPSKKKHHPAPAAPVAVSHPVVLKVSDSRLAPLPSSDKVVSYHAPYDAGDCSICHQSNDAKNPGPVKGAVNDLCMGCHDDFKQVLGRKYAHPAAQQSCVNCHNPHDSMQPKLLIEESGTLCQSCHQEIKKIALESTVKHDALTKATNASTATTRTAPTSSTCWFSSRCSCACNATARTTFWTITAKSSPT